MIRIFSLCLVLIIIAACSSEKDNAVRRPNIVFILADDLGAFDLGYTGTKFYETPNLDNLANQGFVFTNGYAASRVCSPSRASIMTGKFTARHGITDWIGAAAGEDWRKHNRHDKLLPAEYVHNLPAADYTLPEALQANGYRTFFAGKWHLGNEGSYPEDHGFDINVGGWEKGSPIGGFFSPWENPKLENKDAGENLSMRLAKETVDFIKASKDSTFFAFLSFYAVHAPIQTSKEKWQKYSKKAVEAGVKDTGYQMERVLPIRQVQDNPVYAGLLESMDDAIGLVLTSLKDLGLDKNTIVVFTSDNGGVASGDAFATANLPLRGGKGYQWEGGIKEPYLIHVPWLERKLIEYPVINTDFYPTLLDLAELDLVPNQHLDGVSLKGVLEGETLPDRPLFWHYPHYGNQGGEPSSIILKEGWKLIHYWEDNRNELYELATDPAEKQDVSSQYPDRTLDLFNELSAWLNEVGAVTPTIDEAYDAELAARRKDRIQNQLLPRLERERLEFLSEDYLPNEDWWGSKVTRD
ncbi:MAG: sulfatase [Cyclobacteriaceae bacterium]